MATSQFTGTRFQSFKDDGTINDGGKVYFYIADSSFSTFKDTYSDSDLTIPNTNPVILNSAGAADIWLNGQYDVKITDKDDVLIDTVEKYNPSIASTFSRVTTNYTLLAADSGKSFEATGTISLTLKDAAVYGVGWEVTIKNIGSNDVTMARQDSSDTINGTAANIVLKPKQSITIAVSTDELGFFTYLDNFTESYEYTNNMTFSGTTAINGPLTRNSVGGGILPTGSVIPYIAAAAPNGFLLCDGTAVSRTTYSALFTLISTTFGSGDGSTTFNVPDLRGRVPLGSGSGSLAENVAAGGVSASNDTWDVVSNNDVWVTGMKVQVSTDGTLPTGLAVSTDYWIIRASATTIKFATTLANALAGTQIDLTSQGSGTHTVTHTLLSRTLGKKLGKETHALVTGELPAHSHGVTDPGHVHGGVLVGGATSTTSAGADLALGNTTSATTGITIDNAGGSTAHSIMGPSLVLNYIIKT